MVVKRLGMTPMQKLERENKMLKEAIAKLQEQEVKRNNKFKPKIDFRDTQ